MAGSGPNVVLVSRDGGPGLLGYDVGLGQVGVLNFTQPLPSSARTLPPVFVDWTAQLRSTGLTVGQQVLANEQLVQQRAAAPPAYSNCGAARVWWFNDSAAALAMARWLYPDVAITVKGQRVSGAGDSYLSVELSWFVWGGLLVRARGGVLHSRRLQHLLHQPVPVLHTTADVCDVRPTPQHPPRPRQRPAVHRTAERVVDTRA